MQTAAIEMMDPAHENRRALMAKDLAAYKAHPNKPLRPIRNQSVNVPALPHT